jgi:hypothetical protein
VENQVIETLDWVFFVDTIDYVVTLRKASIEHERRLDFTVRYGESKKVGVKKLQQNVQFIS